ncbi:MAG: 3-dehydroquinate synthase [Rhodospirillaceae bacterium]|nr:3-dehydroquinate synthase [Rhodospirillaceae bacterium]
MAARRPRPPVAPGGTPQRPSAAAGRGSAAPPGRAHGAALPGLCRGGHHRGQRRRAARGDARARHVGARGSAASPAVGRGAARGVRGRRDAGRARPAAGGAVKEPDSLRVELGPRSYDILVGRGLIARAGTLLKPVLRQPRVFVLTDDTVAGLHLASLLRALEAGGVAARAVRVPAGEASKDFATLQHVVESLLEAGIERRSTVLALGGGVIGDLAGFAASVVLRGVDFVQVPTTLLAQVDSAVGGKTGINTRLGKNLVGSFHQPRLVIADTDALATLPRRELLAGYAEVVKYGLIGDAPFFAWLEEHGPALLDGEPDLLAHAVVKSCAAKAALVGADERESGPRALLNLGHTFAHALEAECGFSGDLLHGEAVAIGLVMAFELSARLGLCPAEDAARVARHLAAVGLPTGLSALPRRSRDAERLIEAMRRDKKVRDGRMTFVLARGIGRAFLSEDVPLGELRAMLQAAAAA